MSEHEFDFQLSVPITVAKGGDTIEATLIVFQAPTSAVMSQASFLKQAVMQAVKETTDSLTPEALEAAKEQANDAKDARQEKGEEEQDWSPNGDEIIQAVNMASDVQMSALHETFKELCCKKGIATVDGADGEGVKMTKPIFEQIGFRDAEKMLGEYIANFLM